MRVRFELSHLPEHKSGPTLVLRFLDYISRIERLLPDYEGILLFPKPGDLLQRRPRLHLQPKVWTYPLNERKYGTVLKDFVTTTGQGFLCLDDNFSHLSFRDIFGNRISLVLPSLVYSKTSL